MIYNYLIYFLVAIFTLVMAPAISEPSLPWWGSLAGFLIVALAVDHLSSVLFRKRKSRTSSGYFLAEKWACIAALIGFGLLVYAFDLRYYLDFFSWHGRLTSLADTCGLLFFLALLLLVWRRARLAYEYVFVRSYTTHAFLLSNIKVNLPIVIPWVVLSFFNDLLQLIPWPALQKMMDSSHGDLLFFVLFLFFVFFFFPPLVRSLWGCKKIESGPLFEHLRAFCKQQNFSASFYSWPLFEGRMITAGVMGFVPGLRYILVTPALLETMTIAELDAVIAHEIGHVKRYHLFLYLFLLGAFSFVGGFLGQPFFYWFFSQDVFYSSLNWFSLAPETLRDGMSAAVSLVLLLLYFRFVFGFFMRNFERQADLHVLNVVGSFAPIISAFEKIAYMSGNIRDKPSWHHFGIGERVDFLRVCEQDNTQISRHHRKVYGSLLIFICVLASCFALAQVFPTAHYRAVYEKKYVRADLLYNASQEKSPAGWLYFAGNYFLEKGYEKRAMTAYDLAVQYAPVQPDILNNYAWMLLTISEKTLRDPPRALTMAKIAAAQKPTGSILDTLAMAWWANGQTEEAIRVERQALFADPEQAEYYNKQIKRFRSMSYEKGEWKEQRRDRQDSQQVKGEYHAISGRA